VVISTRLNKIYKEVNLIVTLKRALILIKLKEKIVNSCLLNKQMKVIIDNRSH